MATPASTHGLLSGIFGKRQAAVPQQPQAMTPPPSLSDVPAFEQPIAQSLKLVPGNTTNDVANTDTSFFHRNQVFVDNPDALTQPILDHEVLHKIQQQAGNVKSEGDDPDYNYGDLPTLQSRGGSIANLNSEQQAAALQDYMEHRKTLENKAAAGKLTAADLKQADEDDKNYGWLIRQEANMARKGIDVTPAAPGAPPAALTGAIKPLPEIGGKTLQMVPPPRAGQKQAAGALLTGMNPEDAPRDQSFARNKQFAKSGPYVTKLSPQEESEFQAWVKKNPKLVSKDELGPMADYDVRGHWLAAKHGDPEASLTPNKWDGKLHGSDKWKTPYDATFSNQSMYALPNAPSWQGDKLVDSQGRLIVDETPKQTAKLIRPGKGQAIDHKTATAYYRKAGNDPAKARALALKHGWQVQ